MWSKNVRRYVLYCLTFSLFATSLSCNKSGKPEPAEIIWHGKKAVAVRIPISAAKMNTVADVADNAQVRLVTSGQRIPILGEFGEENGVVKFTPLIPFTRGLRYEIVVRGVSIGTFDVPKADPGDAPTLTGIFPSGDTLPENLLKIYLKFSQPMREGQSGSMVSLLKNSSDTIKNAFLDLQPELWNSDRTVLTLWLDPGRIKRDLLPNKSLGAPLVRHNSYRISISKKWQNQQNQGLGRDYFKDFFTVDRDSLSPQPAHWKIDTPKNNTIAALQISFGESLDYGLLNETLSVFSGGTSLPGTWKIDRSERQAHFIPREKWSAGTYVLRAETKLEDVAGNNLNRPFDTDVSVKRKNSSAKYMEIPFGVAP